jgi:hypothetical protein
VKVPLSLGIVISLSLVGRNVEVKAAGGEAIGSIHFICDQLGPEDFAVVPGSEWVLSSGMVANGAIRFHQPARQKHDYAFPECDIYRAAEQENL